MIENVNNNETETLMNEEMTGNLDAAPEVVQPAPPKSEQSQPEQSGTERNPKDWVSEHFKWSEFTHSSTAVRLGLSNIPNETERQNIKQVADVLEKIRAYLNQKHGRVIGIRISSGFRSERVNRAVGGSSTSAHKLGLAADIHATGFTPKQLAMEIEEMMAKGLIHLDQVILEVPKKSNGWVHIGLKQGSQRGQKLLYRGGGYAAVKQFSAVA